MTRLRDQLTLPCRASYVLWRAGLLGDSVTVKFQTGERIILRRSSLLELETAYEIFVSEGYRCPRQLDVASIRRIVDVGSNVGYTVLYWSRHFPLAIIDAFEPHPGHLAVLRRTVELNHLQSRVRLFPLAAGNIAGVQSLVDAGTASTLRTTDGPSRDSVSARVEVVDFFEAIRGPRIDLLKLDCEGSEYDILMDERFSHVDVANLVLEWHATVDRPDIDREIFARLRTLGWCVQPALDSTTSPPNDVGLLRVGTLWAFRS